MDEIEYHIFEDKTIEERGKTSYTFNPKGIKSLVKYYKRYTNNKEFTSTVTKFDSNGNAIEKMSYANDTLLSNKTILTYNSENHLILENHYAQDQILRETYLFIYDNKGNLTEKIVCSFGNYVLKNKYSYDKKNRLVLTEVYNQNLTKTGKYGIIYQNDKIIERNRWSTDNPKQIRTLFTYEANGKHKKEIEYENTLIIHEMEYEYDDFGNPLSLVIRYPNGTKMTTLKKFNNNNNIVEITEKINDEVKSKYFNTYQYDEYNNWIERTWSDDENDKTPSRTKRIISYYN